MYVHTYEEDKHPLWFWMTVYIVVQSLCVGNAQIITPNLPALNGYVHIIDRVSIPAVQVIRGRA